METKMYMEEAILMAIKLYRGGYFSRNKSIEGGGYSSGNKKSTRMKLY